MHANVRLVDAHIDLAHTTVPRTHKRQNNPRVTPSPESRLRGVAETSRRARERLNKEVKRHTDVVGIFPDYASAEKAWRAAAQRTVDDAEMRYVVVHLHRLLEPDLEKPAA